MYDALKSFCRDETGAISVDWVVLTAGIMILATAVGVAVRDGAIVGGENIQAKMETYITK